MDGRGVHIEVEILLPKDQRHHRTLHIQMDVLPIVLVTVPRVSRSCEHFLDGFRGTDMGAVRELGVQRQHQHRLLPLFRGGGGGNQGQNRTLHIQKKVLPIVLVTVPRVSRSCEHFPDGFRGTDMGALRELGVQRQHQHRLSPLLLQRHSFRL